MRIFSIVKGCAGILSSGMTGGLKVQQTAEVCSEVQGCTLYRSGQPKLLSAGCHISVTSLLRRNQFARICICALSSSYFSISRVPLSIQKTVIQPTSGTGVGNRIEKYEEDKAQIQIQAN